MTLEEIEQAILGYPIKELIGTCVGMAAAMNDAKQEYGNEIGDLPPELAKFINRIIDVAEERENK